VSRRAGPGPARRALRLEFGLNFGIPQVPGLRGDLVPRGAAAADLHLADLAGIQVDRKCYAVRNAGPLEPGQHLLDALRVAGQARHACADQRPN